MWVVYGAQESECGLHWLCNSQRGGPVMVKVGEKGLINLMNNEHCI